MNHGIRKQISRRREKKRRFKCAAGGGAAHIICDYNAAHYVHLKVAIPSYVLTSSDPDVWGNFCRALACYPETLDRARAALSAKAQGKPS